MSRKQEIYRDMLMWALPLARTSLMQASALEPFTVLGHKRIRSLRCQYEIAQLVHGLASSILKEEFTDDDICFLNLSARSFYQRRTEACVHHPLFVYFIQELFKAVPEERRHQLEWDGPQEDYEWARPRSGQELGLGLKS